MSLPIIIIFERHWDTIPKSVIRDLLPDLSNKGYGTFCFEAPQNLSSTEIIDRHNSGLAFDSTIQQQAERLLQQAGITRQLSEMSFSNLASLMRLYVSSKKYVDVAEKIKQLPASRILKEVFSEAAKLFISLKGIDINSEDFDTIASANLFRRMSGARREEDHRITTMFQNLLKLRTQQDEGIIFACGALHAKGLIDEFTRHGLQDEVLYYFPHSSSHYDDSVNDIEVLTHDTSDTLVGHMHLLTQKDIQPFGKRVLREITEKTKYTREILDYNSHSQFLSNLFQTHFRAFLRPGYHVDALVDVSEPSNIDDVQQRISATGVQMHHISLNDRNYLVIPNVNTRDIAERIRRI